MFRAVAALVIRGRRFRLIGLQAVIPFEAVFDTVETKYQDLLLATMRTCQVKTKRQIGSVFEHFDMAFTGDCRCRTENCLRVRCPFNSNERQLDGRALALAFFCNLQRPAVDFVTLDNLFRQSPEISWCTRATKIDNRPVHLFTLEIVTLVAFIPVGENFLNHRHFGDSGVNLVGDKSIRFVIDRLIDHGTTFFVLSEIEQRRDEYFCITETS